MTPDARKLRLAVMLLHLPAWVLLTGRRPSPALVRHNVRVLAVTVVLTATTVAAVPAGWGLAAGAAAWMVGHAAWSAALWHRLDWRTGAER
ncbi:MAG: hypothetical protein H6747_01790 [Deltaproteobacteria bacterium]|nr:hypothetical protein [Deltaproteobacteria bacterium]